VPFGVCWQGRATDVKVAGHSNGSAIAREESIADDGKNVCDKDRSKVSCLSYIA